MSGYAISAEPLHEIYPTIEENARRHFAEMKARKDADGLPCGHYNPRLDQYFEASRGGWLLCYVARRGGEPVGHALIYLTQDMHTSDLIASEDVLYVVPEHRNGLGKQMVRYMLADLKARGVKRVDIAPVTDLRVGKIWKRMGFREVATLMTYDLEVADVRA